VTPVLGGLDLGRAGLDLRSPIDVVDLRRDGAPSPRPAARPRRHGTDGSSPHRDTRPGTRPAQHVVATPVPDDAERAMARWLTPSEQAAATRRGERGRAAHVAGRVAAKEAVRAHLAGLGFADIDADRIQITNDERGCPTVAVRGARVATRHLRVSIAHSGAVAVAVAGQASPGGGIGIDVEPVEERSPRFEGLVLGAREQALRPTTGDDRNTWLTRLWAAKEAAAKATGRGFEGRPKAFAVTAVHGARLLVADRWIATEIVSYDGVDHVLATTDALRSELAWHRS
jgi:phosphopantetheinyl transferase (holo-ACP synthase)